MSTRTRGALVYFDEHRRADLLLERAKGDLAPFTDALSVRDWPIGDATIAILSFSDTTLDYICLARKKKQVVTSKNRVEFSSLVDLDSIPVDAIEARLEQRVRQHFVRSSQGVGGLVPEATWRSLLRVIKEIRPNAAAEIERLESLLRFAGYRIAGANAELLLQERDALGTALDIFSGSNKLRERVLGEWAPREEHLNNVNDIEMVATLVDRDEGTSSFMKGIPAQYLQEEAAIQHDLFNWPGMTPMHQAGVSVFHQGDRRLEVIYANRNDLEHTLGIDLIYYNEQYQLFVLVQYKLMREEGETMTYRPDAQLCRELALMDKFSAQFRNCAPIQSHLCYRLNDDGFMVKLVPQKGLRPATGELIRGMYIPREYLHFLLGPNGPRGSNGGSLLTFENSPRYFTNSQFVAFLSKGLIGTRGVQTHQMCALLQAFYETGRAVVLAREQGTAPYPVTEAAA